MLSNHTIGMHKEWWRICEDWAASGLTTRKYCLEKNIPRTKFTYWREKLHFPYLKKPRRVAPNWNEIIKDWEESGLTIKTYCEEKNISPKGLCKKRYKVGHPSYISGKEMANKWREIIKDWESSNLTAGAYALKYELNPSSIRRWDKKLNPHKVHQTRENKALQKWTKIMEEWQMSSLTGFTYCRRSGIEVSSFYKWQKKLNVSGPPKAHLDFTKQEHPEISLEDHFFSVPFSSAMLMGSPAPKKIEALLPQGHQLCVEGMEGQFDEESLSWLTLLLQPKNNIGQDA